MGIIVTQEGQIGFTIIGRPKSNSIQTIVLENNRFWWAETGRPYLTSFGDSLVDAINRDIELHER